MPNETIHKTVHKATIHKRSSGKYTVVRGDRFQVVVDDLHSARHVKRLIDSDRNVTVADLHGDVSGGDVERLLDIAAIARAAVKNLYHELELQGQDAMLFRGLAANLIEPIVWKCEQEMIRRKRAS